MFALVSLGEISVGDPVIFPHCNTITMLKIFSNQHTDSVSRSKSGEKKEAAKCRLFFY